MRTPEEIEAILSQTALLEVTEDICRKHGVMLHQVLRRDRHKSIAGARQAIWFAMYNHPDRNYSYPDIGNVWGYDHVTILNGCRAHRKRTGGELPGEYHGRRTRIESIAGGW